MKSVKITILCAVVSAILPVATVAGADYRPLEIGEITAEGWILNQMTRDMQSGNLSCLNRLRKMGEPFERSNRGYGEFEGNYFDAIVRNAIVSGYGPFLDWSKSLADKILEGQDTRGFLCGMSPKTFEELHSREISLWSQACTLRGLLAYAEYSDDPKYLSAVIEDVDALMALFDRPDCAYFCGESTVEGGARAHGLMFVDVLEDLHRITGDKKYLYFAARLYDDFSEGINLKNRDNKRSYLEDERLPFLFHAPHVAEHSRVVYYLNNFLPGYDELSRKNIEKFTYALSPSGGLITDDFLLECVGGKCGDPDLRYEYCSLSESAISFESLFRKQGDPAIAETVENIVFNAAQAARFSDGKACAYCSKDNQFEAVGDYDKPTFRLQYAACHKIACCVFNQSRLIPYYVQNLWLRSEGGKGLAAAYYGPSNLSTEVGGQEIGIREETMYPFENNIRFTISTRKPIKMPLGFRVPSWATTVSVRINGEALSTKAEDNFISIGRKWNDGDVIELEFGSEVDIFTANNNQFYFKKGALLYALPFKEKLQTVKTFEGETLENYNVVLADPDDKYFYDNLRLEKGLREKYLEDKSYLLFEKSPDADVDHPFDVPYSFISMNLFDGRKPVAVKLVPIGSTVLRRTTFIH